MATKLSQLDRAIAALDAERAVLQLAIDRLRAQQAKQPKRARPAPVVKAVP